jgi:hypothetical protein
MTVYFVTENFIKTRTPISNNVDVSDIAPNIRTAAIEYIRPILGKNFFDDLVEKYNLQTLSANEEELVEIIQMIVAYRATDLTIPFVTFRLANKGIVKLNENIDDKEVLNIVNYIRNEIKKFAHIKENELKKFLDLNKENYPLYIDKINKEIVAPENPETDMGFDII